MKAVSGIHFPLKKCQYLKEKKNCFNFGTKCNNLKSVTFFNLGLCTFWYFEFPVFPSLNHDEDHKSVLINTCAFI